MDYIVPFQEFNVPKWSYYKFPVLQVTLALDAVCIALVFLGFDSHFTESSLIIHILNRCNDFTIRYIVSHSQTS